jgi:hypothetical protein
MAAPTDALAVIPTIAPNSEGPNSKEPHSGVRAADRSPGAHCPVPKKPPTSPEASLRRR